MTSEMSLGPDEPTQERNEALPDGTLLLDDQFTITSKLGNGGFGITYLARDNYLDRSIVIKECFPEAFCHRAGKSVLVRSTANQDKYRSIVNMFMREARAIAKLRHPNVIGVHRVFEENDTAYMALDLIDGQDLLDIIEKEKVVLSPEHIRSILTKLLDAIELIHKQDLLHRDISPDNILLDKWGSPVLIDFGAAREEASRESRAMSAVLVVKDGYSPQEFYFAGGKQTPCSDLYALAASFYHLISGEVPPNSQTRMAEVAGGGKDPCVPLSGRFDAYDPAFLAAIDKAMSVLPKERLQSAREWAEMIGQVNNQMAVEIEPVQKQDLSKTLTRLIIETNEFVKKSGEPSAPKRVLELPPRRKRTVPEWVKEFNAETMEPETIEFAAPQPEETEPETIAPPAVTDAPEPLKLVSDANVTPLVLGTPDRQEAPLLLEPTKEPAAEEPKDDAPIPLPRREADPQVRNRERGSLFRRMTQLGAGWR